ncbi:MAG: outer membrane lipoprotein-sorting protein [Chromatiales bacterium]|nr:outer membrane lipoprotein-sorting protein [Chromatiales bacterium]
MNTHRMISRGVIAFALGVSAASMAGNDKRLAYPNGVPTADEIARQVYYTNHFYAFRNFSIPKTTGTSAILITRDETGDYTRTAVERYLNNNYDDDDSVVARDLAVFLSGRLRGTGMLVTDYADDHKSQDYMIWLPALRKIRRFAEPAHDDAWGGSVFTFGDVSLREPKDETHELIGKKKFRSCLGVITEIESQRHIYVGETPQRSCRHVGKEVYGLKSTTKFENWWYDYRISFVDTESFADYRTVYFKNGEMIKVIDRDWGVVSHSGKNDPRALFWKTWYGADLVNNRESWAIVPQNIIEFDTNKSNSFWTESTLRRLSQ